MTVAMIWPTAMSGSRANRLIFTTTLALTCLGSVAAAKPKYYVAIADVKHVADETCKLETRARALLERELAKHPAVLTRLGDPEPKGAALHKQLKARKLTGYAVILRITRCAHRLLPPRPGHAYKVLSVQVSVAIDAEKLPSSKMAAAGRGSAEVATEVSRVKPSELQSLRIEALDAAIDQAASEFIKGLSGKKRKRRR